jgi:serine/threonine-protein kinase
MFNNKRKKVEPASIVFQAPNRQVNQEQQSPVYPRKKGLSKSFIAMLSVIVLGAVAAYFFYTGEDKEGNILSTTKPIKVNTTSYAQSQGESISQRDSLLSGINNAETTEENQTNPDTSAYANSAGTSSTGQVTNTSSQTTATSDYSHSNNSTYKEETNEPATVKTQYKVLSKAYFYSQPNQKSRLSNSIHYWKRTYAPLNALDEKNGFIYVVFTDDQNKTSEGWLRKKDVKPVKTIMNASDGK